MSVKQIPYSARIKVLSAYVHTCLPGHWPVAAKEPILVRINFTELLIGFFFSPSEDVLSNGIRFSDEKGNAMRD